MGKTLKILLNAAILLIVAGFIVYMVRSVNKEETTFVASTPDAPFTSRYKATATFELPGEIERFEISNSQLFIVSDSVVYIYDTAGKQLAAFSIKPEARDITIEAEQVYILYPTFIEVYDTGGELLRAWEACSDLSDYCSIALAGDHVFVTDAENKNICKYTQEGNFVRFISSPQDFIIPSYSFDIVSRNDTIYCVNSGRHLIESYTPDGDFIAAFGEPGTDPGAFAGCCNPSYITFAPTGHLLTSEKGNPRITSFNPDGTFQSLLLDSKALGGGAYAYKVKVLDDKLFVANKNTVSIYQCDNTLAAQSPCDDCSANCPLRRGLTI